MALKYIEENGEVKCKFEGKLSDLVLSVEVMLMNTLSYEEYVEISKFIGTKGIASRETYEAYQGNGYKLSEEVKHER